MAWLVFTLFGGDTAAARKQGELSFAVLSALKQGLERPHGDPVQILLLCDAANRRADLPVAPLIQDADPGLLGRLQLVADHLGAPFVMMDTASVFKAPPAPLFAQLSDRPLVHSKAGLLSSKPGYAAFASQSETAPKPEAQAYDLGVLGFDPAKAPFPFPNDKYAGNDLDHAECVQIEQLALSQRIAALGPPNVAEETVALYAGRQHPIRHVYHGMQRSMFPAGQPVNCALAPRLPDVKMPPSPFTRRLRAKVGAMRRGFGLGTTAGYHAYLCALAAPTEDGRDVWANIALDHLETSLTPRERLARALPRFAPTALATANLPPETVDRWQAFWRA
jgi:hypothetical protein